MRALLQPKVLESALLASLVSAVLSYPRFCLAPQRHHPIWYLEAVQFLGGTVLWAFVFAWHTRYTGRPVFAFKVEPQVFGWATAAGLAAGALLYLGHDAAVRKVAPLDYPASEEQWVAMALFHLGFVQLFLIFAPFAWLMRLSQRRSAATVMTVLFGVAVLLFRSHLGKAPPPAGLLLASVMIQLGSGFFSVFLFLRGGVLLVCWFSLLSQSRLLLEM